MKKIGIIGGGASGYFLAANLNRYKNKNVTIIEQAKEPLQKVKISGGGRCNVTNACYDLHELVQNYPRGKKELLSVFSVFQPKDTMLWFDKNGVKLKTEKDNRVFPVSNSSSSIIECLRKKASQNGVKELLNHSVQKIEKNGDGTFKVITKGGIFDFEILVITSGSSSKSWQMIQSLGHTVVPPLPSLFTFLSEDDLLKEMAGTSFNKAEVFINQTKLKEKGAVMITHWGLSGPAILRLSAWGAKELADKKYLFDLTVNWLGQKPQEISEIFYSLRKKSPNKILQNCNVEFGLTKRFWSKVLSFTNLKNEIILAELPNKDIIHLTQILTQYKIKVKGKSTFKDEFVTCGGVDLKEINFKTMQSKIIPNLYFAGEVLNIDAITGGFNFQAAWSCAYLIAKELNEEI